MKRLNRLLMVLAMTVVFEACSDDSGTGSNNLFNFGMEDENNTSGSESYLPGSTNGRVIYQNQSSCPVSGYDNKIDVSCAIYSDENQISSTMDIFGSDGSTHASITESYVVDYGKTYANGLVVLNVSGLHASEIRGKLAGKLCSQLKNTYGAPLTVTCSDSTVTMEGSKIKERSQVVDNWKSLCEDACAGLQ